MDYLTWKARQEKRVKKWIKALLANWFRVELFGRYQPVFNSLIIANRTSVIDVLLLCVFLPERLTVAISPQDVRQLGIRVLKLFADVLVIEPASAPALRILIRALRSGRRCLIFSQDLSNQKKSDLNLYNRLGSVLRRLEVEVIPIRVEGAQGSIFAHNKSKNYFHLFPKITLHILPPRSFN